MSLRLLEEVFRMMGRHQLTPAEKAVLEALAAGVRLLEAGQRLAVNPRFVRATVESLRVKYGAKGIDDLIERIASGAEPAALADEVETTAPVFGAIRPRLDGDAFLTLLGPERPDVRCRREACCSGAITHSVMCRRHHVDMLEAAIAAGYTIG
jgi:DNA-binding CsgD family transcriptional regulator